MRLRLYYPNTLSDAHTQEINAFLWMINIGVKSAFHNCKDPFIFTEKAQPWAQYKNNGERHDDRVGIILNEVPVKYASNEKDFFRNGLAKQLSHIVMKSFSSMSEDTIGTAACFFFCEYADPVTKEITTPKPITIMYDFADLAKHQKGRKGRLTPLHTC